MNVKMKYEDEVRRVAGGVRAVEEQVYGKLVIYDALGKVIAKFDLDRVSEWWPEIPVSDVRAKRIDEAVRAVEDALKPDVVRIRYSIGKDWNDEQAIYFRVVLSDDAAAYRPPKVTGDVESRLEQRLDYLALGFHPYHNFRSESEQAALQEEAWA